MGGPGVHMTRLLMIVSSARSMRLADGGDHPTGYWAEEVLEPSERFLRAGVDLVVATPDGNPPQPDQGGARAVLPLPAGRRGLHVLGVPQLRRRRRRYPSHVHPLQRAGPGRAETGVP